MRDFRQTFGEWMFCGDNVSMEDNKVGSCIYNRGRRKVSSGTDLTKLILTEVKI